MLRSARPFALAAAFIGVASSAALASGACDFFAGPGYRGEGFTLYGGHVLLTETVNSQLLNAIAGGSAYQTFTDPRWKGRVVSVRVQAGCTATMTDGAGRVSHASDAPNTGAYGAIAYACVCG